MQSYSRYFLETTGVKFFKLGPIPELLIINYSIAHMGKTLASLQ